MRDIMANTFIALVVIMNKSHSINEQIVILEIPFAKWLMLLFDVKIQH